MSTEYFGTDPIPINFSEIRDKWDDIVCDHVAVFGFDRCDLERFTDYMWDYIVRTGELCGIKLEYEQNKHWYAIDIGGDGYV